jgi:hypothetical protein
MSLPGSVATRFYFSCIFTADAHMVADGVGKGPNAANLRGRLRSHHHHHHHHHHHLRLVIGSKAMLS